MTALVLDISAWSGLQMSKPNISKEELNMLTDKFRLYKILHPNIRDRDCVNCGYSHLNQNQWGATCPEWVLAINEKAQEKACVKSRAIGTCRPYWCIEWIKNV